MQQRTILIAQIYTYLMPGSGEDPYMSEHYEINLLRSITFKYAYAQSLSAR